MSIDSSPRVRRRPRQTGLGRLTPRHGFSGISPASTASRNIFLVVAQRKHSRRERVPSHHHPHQHLLAVHTPDGVKPAILPQLEGRTKQGSVTCPGAPSASVQRPRDTSTPTTRRSASLARRSTLLSGYWVIRTTMAPAVDRVGHKLGSGRSPTFLHLFSGVSARCMLGAVARPLWDERCAGRSRILTQRGEEALDDPGSVRSVVCSRPDLGRHCWGPCLAARRPRSFTAASSARFRTGRAPTFLAPRLKS